MEVVTISEATAQLRALVERAAGGEDVAISLAGIPVVRLTKLGSKRAVRFGVLQGKLVVPEDFDDPLPADVLCGGITSLTGPESEAGLGGEANAGQATADLQERSLQWLAENAAALESSNTYVDERGLPLAKHRKF